MRATTLGSRWLGGLVALLAIAVGGCADSSWEGARQRDTVGSYHQFLRDHPNSGYAAQARERLAYLRVRGQPSIDGFEEFESVYPDSALTDELRAAVESLYFDAARQANTPGAYREFLARYPDGALSAKARGNLVYVESVRNDASASALRSFVAAHPESDFLEEAQRTLELIESRRATNIRRLAVRVDVAPNVAQLERVRRGFASVVAHAYREAGVQVSLIAPGDGPPDGVDAWMRIDYHEAPASGSYGGRTLLSHCRVRLYHRDLEDPVWDRKFEAPADHVLKGAFGRDKTVFANSKFRFWEEFFVPVSTWAVSQSRIQSLSWLEDVEGIDIDGDRAAILLERGGIDFLDVSSPLEPQVVERFRRQSDLTRWTGVLLVDDRLTLIYGPDGAELIRSNELGIDRLERWEATEIGAVRAAARYDQRTLLLASSKGVYAVRPHQRPLAPHRLLDGDFVGLHTRHPYVLLVRPDRVEVATAKHLLRHLTGTRLPLGRTFGAHKARVEGSSLFVFGKTRIVEVDVSKPTAPRAVALLDPDQTGAVSDLAAAGGRVFLLGNRGLQVAGPSAQWVSDAIQVEADRAVELKGRYAFLVGQRILEVVDLTPYQAAIPAAPAESPARASAEKPAETPAEPAETPAEPPETPAETPETPETSETPETPAEKSADD